jgi:Tfp pilus assembly protein PilO
MLFEKRLTTSIVILTVATVLIAAGGIWISTSIHELQELTIAENEKIEKAYNQRRITANTIDTVMDVNKRIRSLGPIDIMEGSELNFINALETAASESRVEQTIQLETANQEELTEWEKDIPLKVSIMGDYRQVILYLHKLERLPYYLTPRSLRIAIPTQREEAGDGTVRADYSSTIRWISKDHPAFKTIEPPSGN